MAVRAKSPGPKRAARKKKAGARKKTGKKKAARRKAERKKKAARRRTQRSGEARPEGNRKLGKSVRASKRPARSRRTPQSARPPERVGFVCEDSAGNTIVSIQLERGEVQAGDAVHILGPDSDFYLRIERLEVAGKAVSVARGGDSVSLRISPPVRANDAVHLLSR